MLQLTEEGFNCTSIEANGIDCVARMLFQEILAETLEAVVHHPKQVPCLPREERSPCFLGDGVPYYRTDSSVTTSG